MTLHQGPWAKDKNSEQETASCHCGHRPWLARIGEVPVGWGWVAAREAEIPELGISFALLPGDRYLWGFTTLPAWRGHDVYPALLQAVLVEEGATRFWIGHDRDNAASAPDMAKAGLREVGTVHRRLDGQLLFVPSAPAERAAAVTFSGEMLSRGIVQGLIDSNRGPTKPDVGQSRRSRASDPGARFGSRQVTRVAIGFDVA